MGGNFLLVGIDSVLFQAGSENHECGRCLVSSGSLRRWLVIALKYIGLLVLALVEEIVLSSQRGAVELVAYFFTGFLQLQVKILAAVRSVGHNGSVIADCEARVAGECRDRVNLRLDQLLVDRLFLGVASGSIYKRKSLLDLPKNIDHGHSSFGVGVSDSNADSGATGDDLVGEIRLRADRVSDHGHSADDANTSWLHFCQSVEKRSDGGCATLVSVHTRLEINFKKVIFGRKDKPYDRRL